jgi:hypothetical protein
MWLFFILPLFVITTALLFHASYSIDAVKADWINYRCNPLYMPFAGMISENVSVAENFEYCMGLMRAEAIKAPIDGVHAIMSTVTEAVSEIAGPLDLFRLMFSRLRLFMLSFTSTTLGKATNSSSVFIAYLIKIRDILQRFAGQGYIASFIAYVSISFIESFVTLCITVIRGFVYAMLSIAIVLALFQPEILALVIDIAAMLAAALA